MLLLIILLLGVAYVFGHTETRRKWITKPVFSFFKRILPPMSSTEKEAMEAGDIWWDGELFRGKPNWEQLHSYSKPTLTAEEQQYIDDKVHTLLAMVDDYKITHEQRDLPENVWQYLKQHGFFSMIIPRQYGGL